MPVLRVDLTHFTFTDKYHRKCESRFADFQ